MDRGPDDIESNRRDGRWGAVAMGVILLLFLSGIIGELLHGGTANRPAWSVSEAITVAFATLWVLATFFAFVVDARRGTFAGQTLLLAAMMLLMTGGLIRECQELRSKVDGEDTIFFTVAIWLVGSYFVVALEWRARSSNKGQPWIAVGWPIVMLAAAPVPTLVLAAVVIVPMRLSEWLSRDVLHPFAGAAVGLAVALATIAVTVALLWRSLRRDTQN